MEKAVLKTLIYADIFDYPLKAYEIHKWLINKKATLRQIEAALTRLNKKSKIKSYKGYYFLPKRDNLVGKRLRREKQSEDYLKKARLIALILKLVPWVKLVGISGGLAMKNAGKSDDIDLFIVASKNHLWISRLSILGLLSLTRQRRKRGTTGRKIAGKFCINILLEEDKLEQINKDIFVVHEVLQMKPLWYRDNIYSKFLADNEWVFKFLPNWVGNARGPVSSVWESLRLPFALRAEPRRASSLTLFAAATRRDPSSLSPLAHLVNLLERLAKMFQLKIMQKPDGMERIEEGALYFHPVDYRFQVLSEYQLRMKRLAALDK